MSSSAKCNVFVFDIETGTARYLVNVFIFSLLDHTQGSHNYWHWWSFQESHFFFLIFISRSLYLPILWHSLTYMLLSLGISFRWHVFLWLSLTAIFGLLLLLLLLLLWGYFKPALAYGFPAGVWVTASLLKSPGLFSVFWPICCLDCLHSFSNFQVFQSLYFSSLARSRYLSFFPLSFNFSPWSAGTAK